VVRRIGFSAQALPERVIAEGLRQLAVLLPSDRRQWVEAVRAEAAEVPAGWQRLNWLAGGLWLTARQAMAGGGPRWVLAFAAAVGGVAWAAWSGPAGDAAVVINRVDVIVMALVLTGLAWATRRISGPVAGSRLARLARVSGYAAILALMLAKSAVERVADAPPNNLAGSYAAWAGEAAYLTVMACYTAVILAATARRSPAAPATVAIGTVAGLAAGTFAYALGPLGFPLRFHGAWSAGFYDGAMTLGIVLSACAPAVAGRVAARRAGPGSGFRQGAMAGVCTGVAAALTVTLLSTATIALLPHDAVLRDWAISHIGQWTSAVGQLTSVDRPRIGYVAGNSAFAAGYLIVLLIGPLAGFSLSAASAWRTRGRPLSPEQPT
jgi:hypothetical protein